MQGGFPFFARYHTAIGAIFLIVVLLSPGGLLGIWEYVRRFAGRALAERRSAAAGAGGEAGPGG